MHKCGIIKCQNVCNSVFREARGHGEGYKMKELHDYVRTIPDFPEKGIMFRDITSVLQDPDGFKLAIDKMQDMVADLDFDLVLGAESRGFIFSAPIAYNRGKGLIPPSLTVDKPRTPWLRDSRLLKCCIWRFSIKFF